jgi:hypothetical protein
MNSNFGTNVFPIAAAVVIIVISIGIASAVQGIPDKPMSQIITVGPVWNTDAWACTSDADFVVHAALRGIGADPLPLIAISVQDHGTQSLYSMDNSESVAFSVGNQADKTITITRTGTVTGFLTLQTTSNAQASCIAI